MNRLGTKYATYAATIPKELYRSKALPAADKLSLVMAALNINPSRTVVVAPSLSGKLAVPAVLARKEMAGVVFVAPVGVPSTLHQRIEIPMLALYGDKDKFGSKVSKQIYTASSSGSIQAIKNASHACYIDNPAAFHFALEKFMEKVDLQYC